MAMEEKLTDVLEAEEAAALKPDYEHEIIEIIRGNASPKAIQTRLDDYHANDIAEVMEDLNAPERKKLYRVCGIPMLAEVFEYLEEEAAGRYLNEMDLQKAAAVIGALETDTAAGVLHEIPKERRSLLIEMLPADIRREIRMIASLD